MFFAVAPILATFIVSVIPIGALLFLPSLLNSQAKRKGGAEKGTLISGIALNLMLCFASGSLVADALLHLLADSIFGDFPSIENTKKQAFASVVGILVFFSMDVLTRSFQGRGPSSEHEEASLSENRGPLLLAPSGNASTSARRRKAQNVSPDLKMLSTGRTSPSPERDSSTCGSCSGNGVLSLIADAIHNFTDGLALAAAFGKDFRLGCTTTLAIFLHEVPHELGDYAILAKAGFSHQKIIWMQLLTAAAAFLGVFSGLAIHSGVLPVFGLIKEENLLPFAAGGFLYVALCNILPEVLNDTKSPRTLISSVLQVAFFMSGIFLMSILE